MATFPLKIVTPDGLIYNDQAKTVIVRTVGGDLAVMARHINCVVPLGMGQAVVVKEDGSRRTAACIGGMLSVADGEVSLVPTTFEWADQIDVSRAEASKHRAEEMLRKKDLSETELRMAEARLKRALIRTGVAKNI